MVGPDWMYCPDKRPVNSAIPGVGPGARRDQAGASSPTRLFVSGVPPTATWRDLALHFEEAGDVLHSDVHLDSSGNPVVRARPQSAQESCSKPGLIVVFFFVDVDMIFLLAFPSDVAVFVDKLTLLGGW